MTISFALITTLGLRRVGTAFVFDKFPLPSIAWLVATKTVAMSWLTERHHDLP